MTNTTPTLPSNVRPLKCSISGNPVSFHIVLLYLRYISDAPQVQTLQASLNRSLSTILHAYGHPTALLAETGIPPLYIIQNVQLAQLRFRLHSCPPATISRFLWQLWQPLLPNVPLNTLESRMQTAVCHVDMALVIPWLAYIQYPWPSCSAYYRKTRVTVLVIVLYFARS